MTDKSLMQLVTSLPDPIPQPFPMELEWLANESSRYLDEGISQGMKMIDAIADDATHKKLVTWVIITLAGYGMGHAESVMDQAIIGHALNLKDVRALVMAAFYLGLSTSAKEDIR